MGQLVNVVVGLATALIGYAIGRVWQQAVDWLRYRRARHFLGPAVRGGVQIVASRFTVSDFNEPTGVVGGGDALALRELTNFFEEIGVKRIETVFVDEGRLNARSNLISLGGQDTNRVTMAAIELLKPNVTIVDPGPGIAMEVHDLAPGIEGHTNEEKSAAQHTYKAIPGRVDYGIVIRAPNPFDTSKALIIIAGAYGYGSWAAIDLIRHPDFLRRCEESDLQHLTNQLQVNRLRARFRHVRQIILGSTGNRDWSGVECIFKVQIFDDRPTAPVVLVFRPLPSALASTEESSALPTRKDLPSADAGSQS